MPQLLIGSKKYHLAFRIIVRCQLRTMDSSHFVLGQGEAICLPQDPFDEKEGKRRAFAAMLKHMRLVTLDLDDKKERRKTWGQFLFWLSGKKKAQIKMKKKPLKLDMQAQGLMPPFASGNPAGGSMGGQTGRGGE